MWFHHIRPNVWCCCVYIPLTEETWLKPMCILNAPTWTVIVFKGTEFKSQSTSVKLNLVQWPQQVKSYLEEVIIHHQTQLYCLMFPLSDQRSIRIWASQLYVGFNHVFWKPTSSLCGRAFVFTENTTDDTNLYFFVFPAYRRIENSRCIIG